MGYLNNQVHFGSRQMLCDGDLDLRGFVLSYCSADRWSLKVGVEKGTTVLVFHLSSVPCV